MPIATEYDPRLGKFGPTIRQDAGAPPFGAAQYDRRFPAPCHPGPWQHRCARRGDEERRSARRFIRPRRCVEGMARRRVHPADVRSILIIEPSSRWTKLRVNRPRRRSHGPHTHHNPTVKIRPPQARASVAAAAMLTFDGRRRKTQGSGSGESRGRRRSRAATAKTSSEPIARRKTRRGAGRTGPRGGNHGRLIGDRMVE